jgi:hypothetical protein
MHTKPSFRFAFGIVALAAVSGCAELDVSNPNNPDLERALASGEDVQNIAVSTVNSWYSDRPFRPSSCAWRAF